jgi:hypothetical protein
MCYYSSVLVFLIASENIILVKKIIMGIAIVFWLFHIVDGYYVAMWLNPGGNQVMISFQNCYILLLRFDPFTGSLPALTSPIC